MNSLSIKVEKILKGSLDSISSPSVKIQIMCGKVCLRRKGKTLLGVANKLLKTIVLYFIYLSFSLKAMGSNPGYLLKSSNRNRNSPNVRGCF